MPLTTYYYTVSLPFNVQNLINNINTNVLPSESPITLVSVSLVGTTLSVAFSDALSSTVSLDLQVTNNSTSIDDRVAASINNNIIVRAATTASVTLSSVINGFVMDGVALKTNDVVLIKDQGTVANGVYTVQTSSSPVRSFLLANTNVGAAVVEISDGTLNTGVAWVCTNAFGSDIVGQST